MEIELKHIEAELPAQDQSNHRTENKNLFKQLGKACIVIDDDPTGNQTVYDIPLLANWSMEVFIKEFIEGTPIFYVLTNSRSLSPEAASERYQEIAENIFKAAKVTKREFTIISRSDSTLRGHFPLEPKTLQHHLKLDNTITVFIPVMFEGNRVTVNDTHYIKDDNLLTPVNKTPFAADHSFKYSNANLKAYIEEKSQGRIRASDVFSFSLKDIRTSSVKVLAESIMEIPPKSYCIFNSLNYADLDKVAQALLLSEKMGKSILYRTSSSFVPSYIGLEPKALLSSDDVLDSKNTNGGLTIVGSYVKKSSEQLHRALTLFNSKTQIEVDVTKVLSDTSRDYTLDLAQRIQTNLENGENVIVFTSRTLVTGLNTGSTINIAATISKALVDLVNSLSVRPKYLIAKGGITSHDLATKGLEMKRSKVLGQIQPGIPLWEMGRETKFPGLPYIVFPGNVGNANTLHTIITKLN